MEDRYLGLIAGATDLLMSAVLKFALQRWALWSTAVFFQRTLDVQAKHVYCRQPYFAHLRMHLA